MVLIRSWKNFLEQASRGCTQIPIGELGSREAGPTWPCKGGLRTKLFLGKRERLCLTVVLILALELVQGCWGPIRQGESMLLPRGPTRSQNNSVPPQWVNGEEIRPVQASLGKGWVFQVLPVTSVDAARTRCAEQRLASYLKMGQAQFGGMFICFLINIKSIYLTWGDTKHLFADGLAMFIFSIF